MARSSDETRPSAHCYACMPQAPGRTPLRGAPAEDQPPALPICAPPARPCEAPAREAMTLSTRIADSALYGHLWGTAEARAILGEDGRLAGWLAVIAALARAQAAAGEIPARAAEL